MALILTAHDLSNGLVASSAVADVKGNWRVSATTTGCPAGQSVDVSLFVQGETGNYAPLIRDGKIVKFMIFGNSTSSISVDNVNAASAQVRVAPQPSATGTISVDSIVTDTVADIDTSIGDLETAITDGSQVTQLADANGNYINPSGTPHSVAAEITRPANTTAYTALDGMARLAAAMAQVETITLTGTPPEKQVDTVTLTGASGTAEITLAGGLTKTVTFATGGTMDLTQTAADFVTSFAADYLAEEIVVTSSGADLIFTSTTYGLAFVSPAIANLTGDLDGSVVNTQANVVVGQATVTGTGGVNALISFDVSTTIDLAATAALFEAAYVGDYAAEGITLTSSGNDIIFTAATPGTAFVAPIVTNTVGDLDGTVVHTTANDNPDVLEFENMAIATGGGGYLMDVKVESDIVAIAGTTVRVWFYNEEPTTIIGDNVAFSHTYGDRDKRMFYVDVVMDAQDGASASIIGQTSVIKEYICAATSLFAQVQTIDGFTPTSGGKINVSISVLILT